MAVGVEPQDILHPQAADGTPLEEPAASEQGVLAPQLDQALGEGQEALLVLAHGPVHPAGLVVLAVAVVVAALGAADGIPPQEHRHPLGQQQGGQEIALLAVAQGPDGRIPAGSFHPAVPAQVVVVAVPVVLLVGFVVLVVVGDQVVEREAVVGRDEVDAGVGGASAGGVEIARTREAVGELADDAAVALPIGPHRVPVAVVPFGPAHGEVAHLVAADPQVPRLGDELHLGEHRILVDDVEEGAQAVHFEQLPGQGRGQIEAEAVHVHLQHPVAQRIHDDLQHPGVAHVEGVAAAGVVHVEARILGHQTVVGGVVDAPEAQGGPQLVALGRMVVDDVQDHFDAGRVQGLHHGLELGNEAGGGVALVRGEEADGVVAPIVV